MKSISNNLYINELFASLVTLSLSKGLSKPCQTLVSLTFSLRLAQTDRVFRDALNSFSIENVFNSYKK